MATVDSGLAVRRAASSDTAVRAEAAIMHGGATDDGGAYLGETRSGLLVCRFLFSPHLRKHYSPPQALAKGPTTKLAMRIWRPRTPRLGSLMRRATQAVRCRGVWALILGLGKGPLRAESGVCMLPPSLDLNVNSAVEGDE